MSHHKRAIGGVLTGLAWALTPVAATALEESEVITYLEQSLEVAIGRDLTDAESAALAEQSRGALAADPAALSEKLPVIAETAMAYRSAQNAAARGIFYDTIRQVFTEIYVRYNEPVALNLFVPKDYLIDQHGLGVGLALSDVYAAAWLRALYEGRFDHPKDVTLTQADLGAMMAEYKMEYPALSPPNQQVLTRMSAWAAGVETNWDKLGPNERRAATGASTSEDPMPANVVVKVTGAADMVKWIAGMDLGISPEIAEKYPTMVEYHQLGGAGEAVLPLLARLGKLDTGAADWSNFQSLQMLQNLNNFYSNNGTMSGADGGAAMFGWQW